MALADDITEAVALFHEGSQFLHDVSTGPSTGPTSSVTNPADLTEQITLARAIQEVSDAGEFLTIASIQTATGKKTFSGGLNKTNDGSHVLDIQEDLNVVPNVEESLFCNSNTSPFLMLWESASTNGGTWASDFPTAGNPTLAPSGSSSIDDAVRWRCDFNLFGNQPVGYLNGTGYAPNRRAVAINCNITAPSGSVTVGEVYMMFTPFDNGVGFDASDPANGWLSNGQSAWGIQIRNTNVQYKLEFRMWANTAAGIVYGNWSGEYHTPNSQIGTRIVMIETYTGTNTVELEASIINRTWFPYNGSFKPESLRVPALTADTSGTTRNYGIRPAYVYTAKAAGVTMNGTLYFAPFEMY